MRKVAVGVLGLALLLMFAFTAPVNADKPTTAPIKAVQVATAAPPVKVWTTNGGIRQAQGIVATGTVQLYIPDTASAPQYTFLLNNVYDMTFDVSEGMPLTIRVNAQWIYPIVGETLGTFEGQIHWNFNSPNIAHGLLHGTGIFEGQKLSFWLDTAIPGPATWVGTLSQ